MVTACYRLLFSLSTEKRQFARLIFGYLINNVYLCASIEKKIVMTDCASLEKVEWFLL